MNRSCASSGQTAVKHEQPSPKLRDGDAAPTCLLKVAVRPFPQLILEYPTFIWLNSGGDPSLSHEDLASD